MSSPVRTGSEQVPADVLERFGRLGRELSTMTVLFHARIAERMGLSGTDHKCLELVMRAAAPLTAGRIAQQSGLSTGAVTGVIDRLERRGFVRRIRDPHDRRKVLVEVVGFDESRYLHLFRSMIELNERVLKRFAPEDWDLLERYNRAMLDEFARLLDEG
ncbi:MAG TPA: MarR family transcriptional regulator [Actinophytocola sp.]|uniref:MarR family winged helix-turn-helix transcriptional regulator n=1 Tax=Actinophytocola sp. TaxID=1872138 RepID=UPI002DB90DAC|nr:MarR family transcriptional regulator [Actinophytocola sp.]HEU5471669.1 MarR family transcriptional regulator [Actinophytocola sp.]